MSSEKNRSEQEWEIVLSEFISSNNDQGDSSHDVGHFKRVYHNAKEIADLGSEPVDPYILVAAAYLHDIVCLPKGHPDSKNSSRYAAIEAKEILKKLHFPEEKIDPVCHAILTHSFTAGLQPETHEAKIIQDADRMEALGALGAIRTFYVCGRMGWEPFDPHDLCGRERQLDDKRFGLDHFWVKLFKLPDLLQTHGGKLYAKQRVSFLQYFVEELQQDFQQKAGGALFVVGACHDAGKRGLKLFDLSDPLARNRALTPACFVIDQVLAIRDRFPLFVHTFISQLQQEIG